MTTKQHLPFLLQHAGILRHSKYSEFYQEYILFQLQKSKNIDHQVRQPERKEKVLTGHFNLVTELKDHVAGLARLNKLKLTLFNESDTY